MALFSRQGIGYLIITLTVSIILTTTAPVNHEDKRLAPDIPYFEEPPQVNLHTRRVKRSEGDGGSGGGGDGVGDSGSSESREGIESGIAPVKGPYMKLVGGGIVPAEDEDDIRIAPREGEGKVRRADSYRTWEEYLENQRNLIKDAVGESKSTVDEGSLLRSVIHSDDHFRFIDKLFKEKNDRVKAFHALVILMREEGKDFKIPQKPKMRL